MLEAPKSRVKLAAPEGQAQVAALPRPLKAGDQEWIRWYSGGRDGLNFQLRIKRTKTGHLHARYQVTPGQGAGWHLEGQLREDNSFVLVGTENGARFEGTLSPLGPITITRFENKDFKLEDLVLNRTEPPPLRTATPAATPPSQAGQEGQPPAAASAEAPLKAGGQEWERWYSGQHEGVNFHVFIQRLGSGQLTGRYQVEGAPGTWPLAGELRSDNTFVLRGTQNSALFSGTMSAQGPITVSSFERGAFKVSGLKLERSAAPATPGSGEVEAAPETPETGSEGPTQGAAEQNTPTTSAARWTGISGARRQEIENIPQGGYTSSENRQMLSGVEMGSLNGVKGYYNGTVESMVWGSHRGKNGEYYGMKWQCVEYVRRYTHLTTGRYLEHKGDAKTWYRKSLSDGASTFDGLTQHRNTSKATGHIEGSKTKPKPDDIIVIGTNTYGHVAIIAEVNDDNIEIAQQNVGTRFKQRLSLSQKAEKWIVGGKTQCWLSPS